VTFASAWPLRLATATVAAFLRSLGGHSRRRPCRAPRPAPHSRQLLVGLTLAFCIGAEALGAPVSESQVKAIFLFNFTQFVSWPADAFSRPEAPLVIAVLGADPFGEDLDAAVRGERAGGRPLVVRRYRTVAEVKDCQILFIDRSEAAKLPDIVAALRGRRILTVSDAEDAAKRGVIIQFVMESNRIRLRINAAVAQADGLTISSKLLRPAQIVDSGGT
jgi:uncharacterized protein DUF4154